MVKEILHDRKDTTFERADCEFKIKIFGDRSGSFLSIEIIFPHSDGTYGGQLFGVGNFDKFQYLEFPNHFGGVYKTLLSDEQKTIFREYAEKYRQITY